jgi:hypothetical protein
MYGSASTATQTSFVLPIPSTDNGVSQYVDLNQCASLLNRKLIKQQALVPVQVSLECGGVGPDGVDYHTSLSASTKMVWKIEALPNTYVTRKSFLLAKAAFLEATKEEREMIKVARWNDFKVHYDYAHAVAGFGANLLPQMVRTDGTTLLQTTGWEASQIADRETANEFVYGFFGAASATYLGMYEQYQLSMEATVPSPDPVGASGDMPYADILAQVDPEDAAVLQGINETPPYSPNALQINPQTYHIGWQNASGSAGIGGVGAPTASYVESSTPFFIAPSGLLKITNVSGDGISHVGSIRINLMAGKDRGLELGGYK